MKRLYVDEKEVVYQKFDKLMQLYDEAIKVAKYFLEDLKNNGIPKGDWELFKSTYLLDTDKSYTKHVETIEKNTITITREVYVQEMEVIENGRTKLIKKYYSEEELKKNGIILLERLTDILHSGREYFVTKIGKNGFAGYIEKLQKNPHSLGLIRGFGDYHWGAREYELYCKLSAIENFHASM